PLAHPSFFLRSDALASAGGYRETGGPEDYELILRMWSEGHRFGKVPEVLLRWREREDRLSRTDPRYAAAA
ncbi:MAG: glycosyl transferase, partial [Gemmatimonadetes bacterium]|nr:glycosyl transferase [Gemmatimonadota bacterium]NIT87473.1 glycosyl transferase [Gemmatimonadota bacterium]NIU31332.1 glycosyl transferase [Gemmatimonadota bacterium]NIV61685.1 glycosyl transferase [Gemmatimonadota bacterium]NIW64398.1 glycosyl transferase [Gemmatimonadota bacterium]